MARDRFDRLREVHPVDQVVGYLLTHHGVAELMRAHRVVLEWDRLVGATVARNAVPDGLHRGVLSVWVRNSPWLHELRLLKDRLVADINAGLGDPPLVTDLRLHFGGKRLYPIDDPVAQLRTWLARRRPPPRRAPTPAPAERRARIERDSAVVDDPELRELIARVRTRWDR